MNRPTWSLQTALVALCAALALLLLPAGAGAAEVVHYTKETLPEFEAQLHAKQIQAVAFNKRIRTMHLTLKDGEHRLVVYKKKGSPALIATLQSRHVPVTVLSTSEAEKEIGTKPHHHKIRYIAGGVLVLVIIIVGAVLIYRRQSRGRD